MEALHFLKFWRSPSALLTTRATDYSGEIHAEKEEEEESFFELDITQENARNTKTTNHVKVREIQLHDIEPQNKRQGHVSPVSPAETVRNLSHDLFFRNRILPIESTSKPQYPVPVLKSGTKLASLSSLGLKKPKAAKSEPNAASSRENFGRGYRSSKGVTKEVIQRYLKLIKPLYARVSKRYGERLKLSDLLSLTSPSSSPAKVTAGEKQTNNPAGFRVVRKHLRKSRLASAGTGVSSPANSRRDDSLLQQDDGIQSAILHCKRSFNSSRGSGVFSRSSSYSTDSLRISTSTDEISETNYLLRF